jgi:single-stranded-DNA-specific exonuclease
VSPRIQRRSLADAPILHDTNIAAVLRRVYAGRGVQSASEVDLRLAHLLPPTLGDLDRACEHLLRWREAQAHITVVGDFDADGATGTAVAVRGLRLLGFQRVDYRVPNRFLHGYGLSPAVVDALDPAPNVILTVDNGVAALAGVTAAKSRGIEVLITDHHLPAETLPEAVAIVNPNLHGDTFPSKALAGVGVVFYLLIALRARLRELGSPQGQVDLSTLLDLVAIGTVADLVALDANNRRLVRAGLQRIREERAHAGVLALFRAAGRDPRRATAADLGFAIGPRINAAGRLEDMALGIECLLCDDALRADAFAQRLNNINYERRDLSRPWSIRPKPCSKPVCPASTPPMCQQDWCCTMPTGIAA